jgi:hypothetical protein
MRLDIVFETFKYYCPQAGQAFTFLLQPKKVNNDLTRPLGTLSKGEGTVAESASRCG